MAKARKKSPSTKRRDRRRLLQWVAKKTEASSPPGPADEVNDGAVVDTCDRTGNGEDDYIVKDNGDGTTKGDATNGDEAARSDSNQAPVGRSTTDRHPPMSIRRDPSSEVPAAPMTKKSPNDHEEEDDTADASRPNQEYAHKEQQFQRALNVALKVGDRVLVKNNDPPGDTGKSPGFYEAKVHVIMKEIGVCPWSRKSGINYKLRPEDEDHVKRTKCRTKLFPCDFEK